MVWEIPQFGPVEGKRWAGVLATAGGVLIYPDPKGDLVAVDERDGRPHRVLEVGLLEPARLECHPLEPREAEEREVEAAVDEAHVDERRVDEADAGEPCAAQNKIERHD